MGSRGGSGGVPDACAKREKLSVTAVTHALMRTVDALQCFIVSHNDYSITCHTDVQLQGVAALKRKANGLSSARHTRITAAAAFAAIT